MDIEQEILSLKNVHPFSTMNADQWERMVRIVKTVTNEDDLPFRYTRLLAVARGNAPKENPSSSATDVTDAREV